MPVDPTVIAVIEASVASAPENFALRLHLVDMLLSAERWSSAGEQCMALLGQRPDDRDALTHAIAAAEGVGDTPRAAAYRRLLGVVDVEQDAPASPVVEAGPSFHQEQLSPLPVDGPPEDEFDSFLRAVVADAGFEVERPTITLADVGGLEDVKRRLNTSFLGPMRNPELRAMYGKSLRGGLLLYGPPGCGKTYLARAVAGELGARFFAVGLDDVLDMYLGQSEQNVHRVFETARRNAPCVLFLDEVDALGLKRSNLTHSGGRNVVVQLLTELDSTRDDNEGVFVLGATNQPWDLDPALRRPGRFDRMLLVLPPDEAARISIIESHLRDRSTDRVDVRKVARETNGYSGADLRLVCESAAEYALEDSIESGTPRLIGTADLQRARHEVQPSTRPWFEVAKNYAMFANQDGTFDELITYMRRNRLG